MEILFVCLGNICRSPSAEAVMKKVVSDAGVTDSIKIDSAGILNYHEGEPADDRMKKHAAKRGYILESISRPVNEGDFSKYDMIIGMDNQNIADLESIAPDGFTNKIHKMTDFLTTLNDTSVPDPYYGGDQGFEYVLDLLEDACDGLLKYIQKQK